MRGGALSSLLHRLPDPRNFLGAQHERQFFQHAVDELVPIGAAEAAPKFDRLVQHLI